MTLALDCQAQDVVNFEALATGVASRER
jgi:hypothetical protein